MTAVANQPRHNIVVVGSTFGRMYMQALQRCPHATVVGLLARGSERSQHLAHTHSIPLLSSINELPPTTNLACVAVRAGSVGGAGTRLAIEMLDRGISVLQELPASADDVTACLRAAHTGGARFAIANLYRWLPSVQIFRATARELLASEQALAIDAHLSIQPAYALAQLLTEIGLPVRPISLRPTDGGTLVTGTLGRTALAVRYATVLDPQDTDNDVRFPAVSVHTRSGTLTLANVHGPVLWFPTLHLPEGARSCAEIDSEQLTQVPAHVELFASHLRHADILADLWPTALAHHITAMSYQTLDSSAAQRTLQVAQLWEQMSAGVDFPTVAEPAATFEQRAALLTRLRTAATAATARIPIAEKEDGPP